MPVRIRLRCPYPPEKTRSRSRSWPQLVRLVLAVSLLAGSMPLSVGACEKGALKGNSQLAARSSPGGSLWTWLGLGLGLGAIGAIVVREGRPGSGAPLDARQALQAERESLHALVDTTPEAFLIADCAGAIVFCNPAAEALFGRTAAELAAFELPRVVAAGSLNKSADELDIVRPNGDLRRVQLHVATAIWAGKPARAISLVDVTERCRAERAWQNSEARARQLVETAAEGICIVKGNGETAFVNQQMARMLGCPSEQLVGKPWKDFALDSGEAEPSPDDRLSKREDLSDRGRDIAFRCCDGPILWGWVRAAPWLADDGSAAGTLYMVTDITHRKQSESQLHHHAYHDSLTGLPNRALLLRCLDDAIARADVFAVLILDLDEFKLVNDSFGHAAGDALLVALARRLESLLGPDDLLARLGGDEFALFASQLTRPEAAARDLAQRLLKLLEQPFQTGDREIFLNGSIGIASSAAAGDNLQPGNLLRDADTAMYAAKARGKGRSSVFRPSMRRRAIHHLQVRTDLNHALARGEFRLSYQPIVWLASGQLAGFEALVRWQHPQRGLLLPGQFVPIAEKTDAIVEIGHWVLETACKQLQHWQRQFVGPDGQAIQMHVNVAVRQLARPDFLPRLDAALAATSLDPRSLKLEIVESALLDSQIATAALLGGLRERQIQIGLDDFGTGYSSLSYLHRLPASVLKIDRSFVSRIGRSGTEIVRTIATLGHGLGLTLIAEGITDLKQLAYLQELGCQQGQGFFFGRPLSAGAATALVASAHRPLGLVASAPRRDA